MENLGTHREKGTEVLTKITQGLRLGSKNIRKKKTLPDTQDNKAHSDEIYANINYWNSREETETEIIKRKDDRITKKSSKLQFIG